MEWFRFYAEVLDDPKVQRLDPWLFKQWINILCLAGKAEPRGILPDMDDIAFALRLSLEEADRAITELRSRELLDERDGILVPHNWHARQKRSDDVTARVQKHRESKTKDETLHETPVKRSRNALEKNKSREEERELSPPIVPPSGGDKPFDLLVALCDEVGQDVSVLSESEKKRQLAAGKVLTTAGATETDIRSMARWLSGQDWVIKGGGLDLKLIAGQHGKWQLNGRPDAPPTGKARASPGRITEDGLPLMENGAVDLKAWNKMRKEASP